MPGNLLGRPPSLHALRRRSPALVRALRRYYAVARLPAAVHGGLVAYRLLLPVRVCTSPRTTTGPLGSRTWSFSACVGSSTPQGRTALAISRSTLLPSLQTDAVGSLDLKISELNTQPTDAPVQRFKCALTAALTWLGARMVRYSFPVRLFHSLLQVGLSRRYPAKIARPSVPSMGRI
jgi:hypothetical protein